MRGTYQVNFPSCYVRRLLSSCWNSKRQIRNQEEYRTTHNSSPIPYKLRLWKEYVFWNQTARLKFWAEAGCLLGQWQRCYLFWLVYFVEPARHTYFRVCVCIRWLFPSDSREPYGISKRKGQDLLLSLETGWKSCSGDILCLMPNTLLSPHLHRSGSPVAQLTSDMVVQRIYSYLFF